MIARIALAFALCVPAALTAEADRKIKPDKYTQAAARVFDQAVVAEQAGDLAAAASLYDQALQVAPHPAPAFNLAEVRRALYLRGGSGAPTWQDVTIDYRVYLTLQTDLAERKLVAAQLEHYAHDPVELRLVGEGVLDLGNAFVLIDGAIVAKPGSTVVPTPRGPMLKLSAPPGPHVIDVVTDVTSGVTTLQIDPLRPLEAVVKAAKPRERGNVVISGTGGRVAMWLRGPAFDSLAPPRRTDVKPGTHQLGVFRRWQEGDWAEVFYQCPPIEVAVPTTGLAYWFIGTDAHGCAANVRHVGLRFP